MESECATSMQHRLACSSSLRSRIITHAHLLQYMNVLTMCCSIIQRLQYMNVSTVAARHALHIVHLASLALPLNEPLPLPSGATSPCMGPLAEQQALPHVARQPACQVPTHVKAVGNEQSTTSSFRSQRQASVIVTPALRRLQLQNSMHARRPLVLMSSWCNLKYQAQLNSG
jgi:hypothetical protein